MTAMDQPNQRGPHTHRMDAPSDVTTWTVVHTVRNVPTDDGRDMTLRDEWWEVPTFVVEALDAARAAVPDAEGLRVKPWLVRLTCCGRADGVYAADSWEDAQAFREAYTSGPGVKGGHVGDTGHDRSAVITDALASTPEADR